jgi:hypothetical protein
VCDMEARQTLRSIAVGFAVCSVSWGSMKKWGEELAVRRECGMVTSCDAIQFDVLNQISILRT